MPSHSQKIKPTEVRHLYVLCLRLLSTVTMLRKTSCSSLKILAAVWGFPSSTLDHYHLWCAPWVTTATLTMNDKVHSSHRINRLMRYQPECVPSRFFLCSHAQQPRHSVKIFFLFVWPGENTARGKTSVGDTERLFSCKNDHRFREGVFMSGAANVCNVRGRREKN